MLTNGYCISCSNHARGGRWDIEIKQSSKDFHRYATTKQIAEDSLEDNVEGTDDHGGLLDILVDKGYQGIKEILGGIHPIRKPVNRSLTPTGQRYK